ncbi:hypothetical protein ATCC90586_006426 [Pythium insidiosum]|nr:hypothetical protein ATCC90586_006426 [Pythium insidiosum]
MRSPTLSLPLLLAAGVLLVAGPSTADATRSGFTCRVLKNPLAMASSTCICAPCHLCEMSFRRMQCQPMLKDADLSDGSEITPTQPLLDPQAWFLTEAELTASRGGVPRQGLSVFTSGNEIQTFVATNEYFSSVYKDIEQTAANDSVYMTGWAMANVPYEPLTDPKGQVSSLQATVTRAVSRGADVRALVWSNLLKRKDTIKVRDIFNALPKPAVGGPARFVFDDRLPSISSSHHQKTVVIRRQNELISYVGGVDVTIDRWDTVKHDQAELRKAANIRRAYDGWLDAHLRIKGPATKDVAANFLSRWNSKVKPSQDRLDDMLDFENPEYSALPAVDANGPLNLKTGKNHHVQITRTFSCKYQRYDEYAPRGEKSILASRLKAIRNAKNYIYIEDQYFVLVPELLQALMDVLPRLQRVIIVTQHPGNDNKITGYEKYLFQMVTPLQKKFPNKVQFYTMKKARNLYIHSKLVIIDDVYLSMGSANWNRRSMTSDSEINANVVDSETVVTPDNLLAARLVRDYRLRKFSEHTGKSVEELSRMRLIDAANAFDVAVNDPSTILDVLEVQEGATFLAFTDSVRETVDPDEKC